MNGAGIDRYCRRAGIPSLPPPWARVLAHAWGRPERYDLHGQPGRQHRLSILT
jgi:hypothetical protein